MARGEFVDAWMYPDDTLRVARFALADGGKTFRPIRRTGDGYAIGDPPGPLPLYRGDMIGDAGPVIVCEGEKCADAAASVGLTAVTSAHGSGSAGKTDWSALAGREVIVLADNDAAGRAYAEEVAAILAGLTPAAKVKIVDLPGLEAGGDIADWIDADGPMGCKSAAEAKADVLELAEQAPPWTPSADPAAEQSHVLPAHVDAADFLAVPLAMADPIVAGLLRRGETATIVSSSKARKSWTVLDLALAVALGRFWFGLSCRHGRVLLIDCELHLATLQHRILAVLRAMGVDPEAVRGRLQVAAWRAHTVTLEGLTGYLAGIRPGDFDLIVADPIYKLYPKGFDENSNAEMAELFGNFTALAERAQAALMLVCHSPKGDTAARATIDLVSGAGSAGRAVDVAVALRAHEAGEPGAPVIVRESITRSFPDLPPACFRWDHPRWIAAPDLDPADLKRAGGRRGKKAAKPAEPVKPVGDATADFAAAHLTEAPQPRAAIIDSAVRAGLSENRAKKALAAAEGRGLAYRWSFGAAKPVQFATKPQGTLDTAEGDK